MNNTIKSFQCSRIKAQELLGRLSTFVQLGLEAGVPCDNNLMTKLSVAQKSITDGKLKIVLVGGFSEGKTSIAAAWLEKLDKASMKISHQESSDMVTVYNIDNECELIDTPGLFGFKEKISDNFNNIQKYKDITKKYVSESHILLYVMSSTNPIKASHKEELIWLFRTLNLLSRSVFVLSRFDEVADIEDDSDYLYNFEIKKKNVIDGLNESINLTDEEKNNLSIVAVSANPFGKDMTYWLQNSEIFKKLSHIDQLQLATTNKIKMNGGPIKVALEVQNTIIADVLDRQLPEAKRNDELVGNELSALKDMSRHLNDKLTLMGKEIKEVQIGLRNFVTDYFADLIVQVNGTDINTFSVFFEREIGEGGVILNSRITSQFEQQINSLSGDLVQLQAKFENEISHYNDVVTSMGKHGVDFVLKGGYINNNNILAFRDGLVSVGKIVGLDLKKLLKFKPYGAASLAKGINGTLAFVGVALEVWDTWSEYQQHENFKKSINELVEALNKERKYKLDVVNGDDFIKNFFPTYIELQNSMTKLNEDIRLQSVRREKFQKWREEGEQLKADFLSSKLSSSDVA